jgi:hypothetical protein
VTGQLYPFDANISGCGKATLGKIGCPACSTCIAIPDYFTALAADAADLAIEVCMCTEFRPVLGKDVQM